MNEYCKNIRIIMEGMVMYESENAKANTVPAAKQLEIDRMVRFFREPDSKLKVLFVGNSITLHGYKPEIGWYGEWGMAASCQENDYVHRVVSALKEKYGPLDYCIAQASKWEMNYFESEQMLEEYYQSARAFEADIVIIRIGENISREAIQKINCKPYYDKMISFFASNENAKVIVTDNFWKIEALDAVFKEVIGENGYIYCQLGDLETDERTMAIGQFEHEGVARHPSDYGMQCIAERILSCI